MWKSFVNSPVASCAHVTVESCPENVKTFKKTFVLKSVWIIVTAQKMKLFLQIFNKCRYKCR